MYLFAWLKKGKRNELKNTPVSVIVCAWNALDHLQALIPALLQQTYQDFEVIIVNDRSDDGTYEYLYELEKKEAKLRVLYIDQTPDHINAKKYAITLGVKAASHEHLIFTDADCIPASNQWLSKMMAGYTEGEQFVLGYSQYQQKAGLLNLFIRLETLWTAIQYMAWAKLGNPYMGVGRNLSYCKSLFLDNKGFFPYQKVLGGDDDLFVQQHANKNNMNIVIGKEALVWSYPNTRLKDYFRQKDRHFAVGKHYKFGVKFWLGLYHFTLVIHWAAIIWLGFMAIITKSVVCDCSMPAILESSPFGFVFYLFCVSLGLRWVLLYVLYGYSTYRLGDRVAFWSVLFFDFLYGIFILGVAIPAIIKKRGSWN